MQQTKAVVLAIIITAVVVGSGVYLLQRNQVSKSTVESEVLPVISTSTLNIAGLSFTLPEEWNSKEIIIEQNKIRKWEVAKIKFPDPKYDVILPMRVLVTNHTIDNNDVLLRETSSGAKIYENFCAPATACYYLGYKNKTYEIVFETAESDQPVPENLDEVWFPDTIITEEDTLNLLSTVR
jgi:hypothetical protein